VLPDLVKLSLRVVNGDLPATVARVDNLAGPISAGICNNVAKVWLVAVFVGGVIVVAARLRFAAGVCIVAACLLIGSSWAAIAVAHADSSNAAAHADVGIDSSGHGSTTVSGPVRGVTKAVQTDMHRRARMLGSWQQTGERRSPATKRLKQELRGAGTKQGMKFSKRFDAIPRVGAASGPPPASDPAPPPASDPQPASDLQPASDPPPTSEPAPALDTASASDSALASTSAPAPDPATGSSTATTSSTATASSTAAPDPATGSSTATTSSTAAPDPATASSTAPASNSAPASNPAPASIPAPASNPAPASTPSAASGTATTSVVVAPASGVIAPVPQVVAWVQSMLTSVFGAFIPLTQLQSDLYSFLMGLADGVPIDKRSEDTGGAGRSAVANASVASQLRLVLLLAGVRVPGVPAAGSAEAATLGRVAASILTVTSELARAPWLPGMASPTPNDNPLAMGLRSFVPQTVSDIPRAASMWALAAVALSGLGGLVIVTLAGVRIGYRQAKAAVELRTTAIARFAGSGPIGIVQSGSMVLIRTRGLRVACPGPLRAEALFEAG
jgi:hypothetical protein